MNPTLRDQRQRERFNARVDRSGGPDACHPWVGNANAKGYGRVWFDGAEQCAHRVAYFLAHSRWPTPLCCHRCDNPPCCNEQHLFEGTHADNHADMDRKGRRVSVGAPKGERNHSAKLTEQDVRDIRANFALCRVTKQELGERFGVSATVIRQIINRKKWAHVHP
jgi:hypothetical protein